MHRWLWLSFVVVLLDQASKRLVVESLKPFEVVELVPHLNLTLTFNEGAAFSLLAQAGGWQRWLLAGVALAIGAILTAWLLRLKPGERALAASLSLILGGAVGNLIDRIALGHVVDFVQVYLPFIPLPLFNPWPAFNLADSAISVGVTLLVVHTIVARDPGDAPVARDT
jgi:signal peptidase II